MSEFMIPFNTLVVLAGVSLFAACAGLVGAFAVLRRRALTGDALAHAALPGLCLGFLLAGERDPRALLLGAFVSGLLGIAVISALCRFTRIKEDAAIGIVLSVFFGLGLVLSRLIQNRSTTGSKAGLDSYLLGKTAGMLIEDVYLIAGVSLFCLAAVLLLYKEFRLVAFDAGFAQVQGWPALKIDLGLMTLLALTVVIGLSAVGVVMVAALLIIPGASARFWTDRLSTLLALAVGLGLIIGVVGTLLSASYSKLPAGPIIVLVGTVVFLASAVLGPRRGVVAGLLRQLRLRRRFAERRLLVRLFERSQTGEPIRIPELAQATARTPRALAPLIRRLQRAGLLSVTAAGIIQLSEAGRRRSAELTRGIRLWEAFLNEYPDLASLANLEAESPEGELPPEMTAALVEKLRLQGRWPG